MESIKFWDLRGKKAFMSSNYKIVPKKVGKFTRNFAVATAPSGIQSWRVLSSK